MKFYFLKLVFGHKVLRANRLSLRLKLRRQRRHQPPRLGSMLSSFRRPKLPKSIDNDVYDLVDLRERSEKEKRNYVTGRWVLHIK